MKKDSIWLNVVLGACLLFWVFDIFEAIIYKH